MPDDLTFLKRATAIVHGIRDDLDDLGQMRASRELEAQLAFECMDAYHDLRKAEEQHGYMSTEYSSTRVAYIIKTEEHRLALERFERLHCPLPPCDETEPRAELSEDERNRRNWVNR